MSEKRAMLSLFHQLMKQARNIDNYNFRNYAIRRVRDGFRANKTEQDVEKLERLRKEAQSSLELLKRQALLSHLYHERGNILEKER